MKKLSVIVTGVSNNERFINNIFTEIGEEITVELKDNEMLFYNIDTSKTEMLYNVLAKNVVSEFSKKILIKIINKNCDYFNKKDKYEVWKLATKRLLNDEFEKNADYFFRINSVRKSIEEFLNFSDTVSVEGFANFRLKDLEEELEEILEECVQEHLLDLEYAEFINMLKYFLSIQNSKYLKVEISYGKDIVVKADGKDITKECLADFLSEEVSNESSIDDFLLNSLISIAPKRVFINQDGKMLNDEFKKTLQGIFGDRITIT